LNVGSRIGLQLELGEEALIRRDETQGEQDELGREELLRKKGKSEFVSGIHMLLRIPTFSDPGIFSIDHWPPF